MRGAVAAASRSMCEVWRWALGERDDLRALPQFELLAALRTDGWTGGERRRGWANAPLRVVGAEVADAVSMRPMLEAAGTDSSLASELWRGLVEMVLVDLGAGAVPHGIPATGSASLAALLAVADSAQSGGRLSEVLATALSDEARGAVGWGDALVLHRLARRYLDGNGLVGGDVEGAGFGREFGRVFRVVFHVVFRQIVAASPLTALWDEAAAGAATRWQPAVTWLRWAPPEAVDATWRRALEAVADAATTSAAERALTRIVALAGRVGEGDVLESLARIFGAALGLDEGQVPVAGKGDETPGLRDLRNLLVRGAGPSCAALGQYLDRGGAVLPKLCEPWWIGAQDSNRETRVARR